MSLERRGGCHPDQMDADLPPDNEEEAVDDREVRTAEDRARIEREVRQHFAAHLGPVERLRDFAVAHLAPWRGRALEPAGVDALLAAEGSRATKTFHGALHLVLGGFGPQAAMLNRSLFEGMAVAHWLTAEPDEALRRFEDHDLHNRLLWSGTLGKRGWLKDGEEVPIVADDERRRLDSLFGRYGERSWTGLSLYELMKAIEHLWPQGPSRDDLWEFFEVAHRDNNQMLHSTVGALTAGVRVGEDDASLSFDGFPSGRHIRRACVGMFWIYMQTLTLLFSHFGIPDRDELDRIWLEGRDVFTG